MSLVPLVAHELSKPENAAMAVDLLGQATSGAFKMFKKRKPYKKGRSTKHKKHIQTLGRRAGFNSSRRVDRQSTVVTTANKELNQINLIQVEKNVSGDEAINKRSRDTILHKGVKVCFSCKNILKKTVFLNWAIVLPKAQNNVSSANILRSNSIDRDVALNENLSFMDLRCLPINTDMYRVIQQKTIMITPDSNKSVGDEGDDIRMIETFVPTNRQLFFDGSTAVPLQNMFMVWWVDYHDSPTGIGSAIDTADISWRLVNYFRDIP